MFIANYLSCEMIFNKCNCEKMKKKLLWSFIGGKGNPTNPEMMFEKKLLSHSEQLLIMVSYEPHVSLFRRNWVIRSLDLQNIKHLITASCVV